MNVPKIIYYVFTFLAVLSGILVLVVGVTLLVALINIRENFDVDVAACEKAMICLGLITFLVSSFVFCCIKDNPYMYVGHGVIAIVLGISFIIISAKISANIKKWNEVADEMIREAMPDLKLPDLPPIDDAHLERHRNATSGTKIVEVPSGISMFMQTFECCGKNGKQDFELPENVDLPLPSFCCPKDVEECDRDEAFDQGCGDAINDLFKKLKEYVVTACSLCAFILFVDGGFALFFGVQALIKKDAAPPPAA